MSLPISLLVFQETNSTLLAAIIMICSMLPDIILPILVAPFIDKGTKKKWIVGLDSALVILYFVMGIWIYHHEFSYILYVGFVLIVGTISVFYRLAYDAWYPDLIPNGLEQKGYAVSSTIYPAVIVTMAPMATFLFSKVSMTVIFLMVACISFVSVIIELFISATNSICGEKYTFSEYLSDLKEGFIFMKKEKGIRNIYTYMSITNGASEGIGILTQAYFQTNPILNITMFGFLTSAEMLGRLFGGVFQYTKEIPAKKRYG